MNNVAAILDGNLSHNLMDERYEIDFYDLSLENKGRILMKILKHYEDLLIDDVGYEKTKRFLQAEFSQYEALIQKVLIILEQEEELAVRKVSLSELMSGDLIFEDIKTKTGILLIGKDTQISTNLLRMLRRFSRHEQVVEPIYIKTEIQY
jgi:tRNA splicing ligase